MGLLDPAYIVPLKGFQVQDCHGAESSERENSPVTPPDLIGHYVVMVPELKIHDPVLQELIDRFLDGVLNLPGTEDTLLFMEACNDCSCGN